MVEGKQKQGLEKQFQAAFAAILNKIGANEFVTTHFEGLLKVQLVQTPTEANLAYQYFDELEKKIEPSTTKLVEALDEDKDEILKKRRELLYEYITHVDDLFRDYVEKKHGRTTAGDTRIDVTDTPGEEANQFPVYVRASSVQELASLFNEILDDLKLDAYKITLPPEQGRGGRI